MLRLKIGGLGTGPTGAGYFISESNEAGFTMADVAAICDISASSKRKSSSGSTIGCKGIGFKSVFTVSDHPHVLSQSFTFAFDVKGPLGKLGYVTPTWLTQEDIAALPAEVRKAHAAGLTVLYLPLKRVTLAADIQQEMEHLASQGRATLLFLKQLETIELIPLNGVRRVLRRNIREESSALAVVDEEVDGRHVEHSYHIHHHDIKDRGKDDEAWRLVLAFPVPDETEHAAQSDND
eukprot:TRINITY_DN24356_c0_g1_i1.p1 TRINITY_DN24356_c0_g1~~TRINITY_DN24356_c0_g1_i1.p1  ORF type:complete len:266 (-),score=35.07 TRINITY_DN24356_c0_g1_i1:23-730(-)